MLRPGSEFRPRELLSPIFPYHPLWPKFESILIEGVCFLKQPIGEPERLEALHLGIQYGNHKSAKAAVDSVVPMIALEVEKAWQVQLPAHRLLELRGAMVTPLGCAHQTSISELGEHVDKDSPHS